MDNDCLIYLHDLFSLTARYVLVGNISSLSAQCLPYSKSIWIHEE